MTRTWHTISVKVEQTATQAVESALNDLGGIGTSIDSLRRQQDEPAMVIGYFDDAPAMRAVRAAIERELVIDGRDLDALLGIEAGEIEDTDWLAEWKGHWQPSQVGKFIVGPPWAEVGETERHIIRIEPNMAFGTGTHETTQLCLEAIGESYEPSMSFLDVGTGTGILAIAAAKLGGEDIDACDVDADSVRIARENARLNGVGEHIRFIDGSIDDVTPPHDFVCANLTIDVIVPILPTLVGKARQYLLLSGILAVQEPMITRELSRSEISNFKLERSGEWIAITLRTT